MAGGVAAEAIAAELGGLPAKARRTITHYNGGEFARHEAVTEAARSQDGGITEAAAYWREVGPAALVSPCICDDGLAEALGLPPFIAVRDDELAELRAALDEAAGIAYAA